jgi:PAS domain S-box-containing protein
MEEALRLSEERFAKAFNVCPIPTIITTLAEGKIINANDSFIKMYGFNQEEILGKTTSEIFWFDPADRSLLTKRIIEEGSFRETEVIFQRKPGEKRLGLLSAELLNINGTPCILGVCKDITELRKMETNLARLDRLNLVGEMAASIGHEIRNPMTTVRGYLQILRDGKDYTQATEYFDLMIEELDRANSIITEFLSLAKNKMVELKTGNLNSIIIKLLPLIESKAIGRDHNIKLELHDIPDLLIDKEEIHQLVFNLVDNGLESMSSAGVVTIRTFMENEQVVLAVQDQGHGIDRRLLDKLGTPFLTTKEQGTGLGLAVCYRIAARHNAEIDIVTNSTGTTFYVKFLIPMGATMAGCKTS